MLEKGSFIKLVKTTSSYEDVYNGTIVALSKQKLKIEVKNSKLFYLKDNEEVKFQFFNGDDLYSFDAIILKEQKEDEKKRHIFIKTPKIAKKMLRRKSRRVRLEKDIYVKIEERSFYGTSINLSLNGIYLTTHEELRVDDITFISFDLMKKKFLRNIEGKVIRKEVHMYGGEEEHYCYAFEFQNLTDDLIDNLEEFLNDL